MINTKNANQIMRFDSRGGFVEVLNNAFTIGKVQFNFVQYDQKTNKQTNKISIYMNIEKALYLAEIILNGRLENTIFYAKNNGTFENKPVNDYTSYFIDMGGQSEKRANRPDGLGLSRQFKIQSGKVAPYIFRAEQGPGKSNQQGLIVPQGKPETYVNIPMTQENITIFASKLKMHLQAYINHIYADYGDIIFQNESIDTFYNQNKNKTQGQQQQQQYQQTQQQYQQQYQPQEQTNNQGYTNY